MADEYLEGIMAKIKPAGKIEVTDEMVTVAMREFEKFAARLLRYPEKDRWHMNDVTGMREALKAALALVKQT